MSRVTTAALPLSVLVCGLFLTGTAHAQNEESRREYFTPGLVVETTGARRGACDVLTFTADGKYLLAAGDDKAVRVWRFTAARGLEPAELPTLRWPSWHESRGNIYAAALSPDNRLVAVGGQGMSSAGDSLAVFDRTTGAILHTFTGSRKPKRGTTWAMAFSPDGKQVAYGTHNGGVWLWDPEAGPKAEPIPLKLSDSGDSVYVKLLRYLPRGGGLLAVLTNGSVLRWDAPAAGAKPRQLFKFATDELFRIAISPDGKWLAGASASLDHPNLVELRQLATGVRRTVPLGPGHWAHSLAFDPNSKRLAIGVRVVGRLKPGATNNFYREIADKVYLHELGTPGAEQLKNIKPTYHTEAMAFHPNGPYLAIAGGDDHEVTVWKLDAGRQTKVGKEAVGPGMGLWSVALSGDGRYLAFKGKRDPAAQSPNERGAGKWTFFDLEKRRWAPDNAFRPTPAENNQDGWELQTSTEEARQDNRVWYVKAPSGKRYALPLNRERDWLPRCYAFLPPTKAKDGKPAQPVRLAVGHLWGVTVFDLTAKGPVARRMFAGHEGEVMALALDKNYERMVTVSRDETVAGWSLADWPGQRELGARFYLRGGRLWVGKVSAGSPAWEAGLSEDDEIIGLVVAPSRKPLFNHGVGLTHWGKDTGTAAEALEALDNAKPGMEHYFAFRRQGKGKVIEQLTSVRQRPLWRFFPTAKGDWVLWRWRDYYYDTSTKGDYLIGWQRNYKDLTKIPDFYKAEQFRKEYHKPELVAAMLKNWKEAPEKSMFIKLLPPQVTIALVPGGKPGEVKVTLTATPRGERENQQIARVLLWVNDYQFKVWEGAELKLKDGVFRTTEVIPRARMRRGENPVTVQAFNRGDIRSEAKPIFIANAPPPSAPDLYGVFIGVGNYNGAKIGHRLNGLYANEDAVAMHRLWNRRAGGLYRKVYLVPPLIDGDATRTAILKQLADLEGKVKPDDRLIFHIGGHGTRPAELAGVIAGLDVPKQRRAQLAKQLDGLGEFLFCCPDLDIDHLRDTTVGFDELYKLLVRLPCHKILLLDACHAGGARAGPESEAVNPIRAMTPAGVGPIILAACRPHESAYEDPTIDLSQAYGLFTIAVRKTLQEQFDNADKNGDKILEPQELYDQVCVEVKDMMQQLRKDRLATKDDQQQPDAWLPSLESRLPLVRRPEKK